MQDLPKELQEEILFSLREPGDLYRACSVSRGNRQICSSASFWRAKFRREGLPLLEEESASFNLQQWLESYEKSLQSAQLAHEELADPREDGINLADVYDLSLLPGLEDILEEAWEKVHSGENVTRVVTGVNNRGEEIFTETTDEYFIFLQPKTIAGERGYGYDIIRESTIDEGGRTHGDLEEIDTDVFMSREDAWKVYFGLFYFDSLES
ncbi:hypothetical protein BQ9231_00368 [Cedratvirus lausannensis]|uniref:F-box domain-containing protein n=1 Tax=Cedratvirus lausannensis TaxID=2023205 RepID=A0A285PX94_9VIRU|nr:hypothetical protein BQ9231_00368 [Cedratvirus lausannensis]